MSNLPTPVAVIGGTGDLGQGFCRFLADAGVPTVIGSRTEEKGDRVAGEISREVGSSSLSGTDNVSAAREAEFVVLAIPFSAHQYILADVAGECEDKPVLDTSVPLVEGQPDQYDEPEAGSAGYHVQSHLPESSDLATGFHTLSAKKLTDPDNPPGSEVFYCGDEDARTAAAALAEELGIRAHDAGDLRRSATLERLTPLLIHFNMQYGESGLGFKLV